MLINITAPYLVAAQNENICAGQEQDVRFNDPSKCKAFIVCVFENAVGATCPPAQPNFNPNTLECATAEEYPCKDADDDGSDQTTTTEPTEDTDLISTTEQVITSTETEPLTTTTEEETPSTTVNPFAHVCADQRNGRFVNDPRRCDAYFWCRNGFAIPQVCEHNLPFNEHEQLCDWAYECEDGSTTQQPPTSTTEVTPPVSTTEVTSPATTTEVIPPTTTTEAPTVEQRCAANGVGYFVDNP